jgi:protein-tyrosine phosphatase
MISQNFGTHRGLIRLLLSYAEVAAGQASIIVPDNEKIKRLVFVCHGNICRSAVADQYAKRLGLNSASFGLSTSMNMPAHPPAAEVAASMGVHLESHLTTTQQEFVPMPGDLLLAMEVRHLRKIAEIPKFQNFPRSLLGLYANPKFPHLHDPYKLNPDYMLVCLRRVLSAVNQLKRDFSYATIPK